MESTNYIKEIFNLRKKRDLQMFMNDKPFKVSGSLKDTFDGTLEKTLRFICDIHGETADKLRGIKEVGGKLYFGWIPTKNRDDDTLDEEYMKQWDIVLSGDIMKPSFNMLIEIIINWLNSDNAADEYDRLYEESDLDYAEEVIKGWTISSITYDDNCPSFSVFSVAPRWEEIGK